MVMPLPQGESFIELDVRDRIRALLDLGVVSELLDPSERINSPWLARQGIAAQADDGVVVAQGRIAGNKTVVLAIDGSFQGGSMGEVGGAKIAAALELAAEDNRRGVPTRAVLLLESGGVRLQEGNLGLAAVADIHAALVDLRRYQPVVGIVAGPIGCYGGMSLAAGLCSYLIVTREGRLSLNGPAVIEQEAGIDEFDSCDKPFIWRLTGGEQRHGSGLADELVADDINEVRAALLDCLQRGLPLIHRSERCNGFVRVLGALDPEARLDPADMRVWLKKAMDESDIEEPGLVEQVGNEPDHGAFVPSSVAAVASRGAAWLAGLTTDAPARPGFPDSVRVIDALLDGEPVRYITVVPDPANRFPRARHGEMGLTEGWHLARAIRQCEMQDGVPMGDDADHDPMGERLAVTGAAGVPRRRPIVAIIDVPSQAYGRLEEGMGLHQSLTSIVDAGAQARLAGHPFIGFIVGQALSGAFLALGCQANRLIALRDSGVQVQAMGKASAARITQRTIEQLDALAVPVPPMAYDIDSYASLGMLWQTMEVDNADQPTAQDLAQAKTLLSQAIADIRADPRRDLSDRLGAPNRQASVRVRRRMQELWR